MEDIFFRERRIVLAQRHLVWDLLSSASALVKWIPNATSIEQLNNNSLCKGSILWVEMVSNDDPIIQLMSIEDFIQGEKIAFVFKIDERDVKFTFEIETHSVGSSVIKLTCDSVHLNIIGRKKKKHKILVLAW